MKKYISVLAMVALISACSTIGVNTVTEKLSPEILTKYRPATDTDRDINRKPLETLEFAKISSGKKVVDYVPGSGYFTRLFSNAVGETGMVYSITPQIIIDKYAKGVVPSFAGEEGHKNSVGMASGTADLNIPKDIDVFFTSQNYHDVRLYLGDNATTNLNNSVFASLKKGGYYVIIDHTGEANLTEAGIKELHRIDPKIVIKEVEAAGFKLDATSEILKNPNDSLKANVFDPSIRGKTDQFVYRFVKP